MEECSSTAFFLRAPLRCVVVSHACTCNMSGLRISLRSSPCVIRFRPTQQPVAASDDNLHKEQHLLDIILCSNKCIGTNESNAEAPSAPASSSGAVWSTPCCSSHRPRKFSASRACCRVTGQTTHAAQSTRQSTPDSRSARRSGFYIFGDCPSIRWPFPSEQQDLRPSAFRVGCAS